SAERSGSSADTGEFVRIESQKVGAREAVVKIESDGHPNASVRDRDRGRGRSPGAWSVAAVLDAVCDREEGLEAGAVRVEPPGDSLDRTRHESGHNPAPASDQGQGMGRRRWRRLVAGGGGQWQTGRGAGLDRCPSASGQKTQE